MNSSYNDILRNKSCKLLSKVLDNDEKKSRHIEKDIYNSVIDYSKRNNIKRTWECITFKSIYLSRIRSIYSNIKSDSYIENINFKGKIMSGEIDTKNISNLSHIDIFPEKWKVLIEDKMKKEKLRYELKPEAMTDMFKCGRCGSRSCTYYEMQTRSADEPMTQFITCIDCNNHWKQ
jgi:transcription elongation factor S-II|tara:strand:+ start:1005 stop:1532 length:528 start_codon:yes stop_codon:yes gene_type:complete